MVVQLLIYFIVLPRLIQVAAVALQEPDKCFETCGNVTIPSPFGIADGCYKNSWFRVTCNQTADGLKPFISGINLELLGSLWNDGDVAVKLPVTYLNCLYKGDNAAASVNLGGTPFFFSSRFNVFGSVGCGNFAIILANQTVPIGGCLQPNCGDLTSKFGGCFSLIPENLTSYTATITSHTVSVDYNDYRCASAFMFDMSLLHPNFTFPHGITINTTHVPATLEWNTSVFCDEDPVCPRNLACIERCGNVDIQYPFGIEAGCYMNDWFRVTCNETIDGRKPFIIGINLELLSVTFSAGRVVVNNPITYFNCRYYDQDSNNGVSVNLTGSPFFFSHVYNRFVSVGCGSFATISRSRTDYPFGSCMQPSCSNITGNSNGSCLTLIPPGLSAFVANMTESHDKFCGSAFLVDQSLLDSHGVKILDPNQISTRTLASTTLQWGRPTTGLCNMDEVSQIICSSDGHYCWTRLSPSHLCVCSDNRDYYSTDVCKETGRCNYPYCNVLCLNTPGNYCSLPCPNGYEYSSILDYCQLIYLPEEETATLSYGIVIGWITSIGTLFLLLATRLMFEVLKRRKNFKLKQKYFKRNGGLLLQKHLYSSKGNVEKIRLFTSKELEMATNYYNENRMLGQGGQGTVYKGMLRDGSIVAIKKSKIMEGKNFDEKKVEQFVNEVIILSQINHRNVVKLLGCCLGAEVPLLVYEFVPNGTLYDLIHYPSEEFPLTWDMRLRIAVEIANALFYLHSAASVPIYHRDIKSSNILLDDKYRAKVSDFGISRSIALEQTHLTTRVQGTFGYMDPEYFRSSQFTDKSDVYSFGVVVVELLTGQKPISSRQPDEVRSLVTIFMLSMKENSPVDILDPMLMNGGSEGEIMAVAKLAKRCLNHNGKKRPTMKQVATELEWIRAPDANAIQQINNEDSDIDDVIEPLAFACSSSSRS